MLGLTLSLNVYGASAATIGTADTKNPILTQGHQQQKMLR